METILVIDNEKEMQEMYEELLYLQGYRVISAYSGEEGLQKVEKYPIDLIILDMEMGAGMNGLQVIAALKKNKKKIPIIVATGKIGMEKDPEIALAGNVHRFMTKPFSLKELAETIRRILDAGKQQPADAVQTHAPQPQTSVHRNKTSSRLVKAGCVIEECIGKGGSGTVYKGSYLGTPVAIKVLRGDTLADQETLIRFQREAQILASIRHPNVIELLNTGKTAEGEHFIVMNFFPGRTVEAIIAQEQRLSQAESLSIITKAADGMAAAHRQKLVHRDLKPSNILYHRPTGEVKVIDFGISRRIAVDQTITQQGFVMGTPQYMSPEQCRADVVDQRCDIYALGACFYFMLVGKGPFDRRTVLETLMAQVYDSIRWPDLEPPISPVICQIIEKMTAKDTDDRYSSMEECRQVLEQAKTILENTR
jgi:CheY-like chemotaxis protein/tRNA A-37 threonylcarbamoyl transferase component Bud32